MGKIKLGKTTQNKIKSDIVEPTHTLAPIIPPSIIIKEVPVETTIVKEVLVEVPVEKLVEVVKEVIVEVPVEKIVEVVKEVLVEVPVEKIVTQYDVLEVRDIKGDIEKNKKIKELQKQNNLLRLLLVAAVLTAVCLVG